MSLLNVKWFTSKFGNMSTHLNKIVSAAPKASVFKILRDGVATITDRKVSAENFLACFTTSDDVYSDDLAENGVARQVIPSSFTDTDILESCYFDIDLPTYLFHDLPEKLVLNGPVASHVSGFSATCDSTLVPMTEQYTYCWCTDVNGVQHRVNLWHLTISPTTIHARILNVVPLSSSTDRGYGLMLPFLRHILSTDATSLLLFRELCHYTTVAQSSIGSLSVQLAGRVIDLVSESTSRVNDWKESFISYITTNGTKISDGEYTLSFTDINGSPYTLRVSIGGDHDQDIFANWSDLANTFFIMTTADGLVTNNVCMDNNGMSHSLNDFISSQIVSNQINEFIMVASDYALSNTSDVNELASTLAVKSGEWVSTVRELCPGAIQAFKKGGFYSLAVYLNAYFATTTSTAVSDEGTTLEFTDSSTWVPNDYISGFVGTLSNVISSIGLAIIAFGSKILGAIVSVAGLIGQIITPLFTAPWDATRFQLTDNPDTIFGMAPYAPFHGTLRNWRDIFDESDINKIETEKNCFYAQVPGGYLLFGPGFYNTDGSVLDLNWEFHPDILDRRGASDQLFRAGGLNVSDWVTGTYTTNGSSYCVASLSSRLASNANSWRAKLDSILESFEPSYPEPNSEGYLSESVICQIIECNILLFLIHTSWLFRPTTEPYDEASLVAETLIQGYNRCSFMASTYGLTNSVIHATWRAGRYSSNASGYFAMLTDIVGTAPAITMYEDDIVTPIQYSTGILTSAINAWNSSSPWSGEYTPLATIAWDDLFTGSWTPIPTEYSYALKTPSYTWDSVLVGTVLGAILTATVAVGAIALSISAIKGLRKAKAKRSAETEKAWSAFTANPNEENYQVYRKTAKRNNLLATFFGGTKYDTSNYWNASSSGQPSATSAVSAINSALSEQAESVESSQTVRSINSLDSVIKLIRGAATPETI